MSADGGDAFNLGNGATLPVKNLLRQQVSSKTGVVMYITQRNVTNARLTDQGNSHDSTRCYFDKLFNLFGVK